MKNLALKIGRDVFSDEIRGIKRYISGKVCEKCTTTGRSGIIFVAYNDALYEIAPSEYEDHQDIILGKNGGRKLAPDTMYFIRIGKYNVMEVITVDEKYNDANNGQYTTQRLTVKFYGPNRKHAKAIFSKKVMEYASVDSIHMISLVGRVPTTTRISRRPMDSIILDDSTKNALVNGVMTWKKSKDWYLSHFLKYKLGILLYGKPGCGKSSLIRAIASMLDNACIIKFDIKAIAVAVQEIQGFVSKQSRTTFVVVLEDIDMLCGKRDESLNESDEYQRMLRSQNALFQMLDGLHSTDQTIYIATTNHIDQLDPALIRPGRFDIVEEIKAFDHDQSIEFLKMFGYDEIFYNENVDDKLDLPIQPAKLQQMIMEDRSKDLYNK